MINQITCYTFNANKKVLGVSAVICWSPEESIFPQISSFYIATSQLSCKREGQK